VGRAAVNVVFFNSTRSWALSLNLLQVAREKNYFSLFKLFKGAFYKNCMHELFLSVKSREK
jgi:hypothetical protein